MAVAVALSERQRAQEVERVKAELAKSEKTGRAYNSEANLEAVLVLDPVFVRGLRWNDFAGVVEWAGIGGGAFVHLEDEHLTEIRLAIGATYGFTPSMTRAAELVRYTAKGRGHHPVREWLQGLVWDGEPRLATMLHRLVGADDTLLHAEMGVRFAVAAVARVMDPGCKVDTTLILVGPQGAGKSTFFRALAGAEWFRDTPIDMRHKDAYMALRGAWLYEMAELASMRPRDAETVKAFLSAQVDHFRPPYGRLSIEQKRQCVFVGTTNETGFLNDPTGARRFWPVKAGTIDVVRVTRERDQLWAEAVELYDGGAEWWLPAHLEADLRAEHEKYVAEDPWQTQIEDWLVSRHGDVSVAEILGVCLEIEAGRQNRSHEMRVAGVLARLGWGRQRVTVGGSRRWVYRRGEA